MTGGGGGSEAVSFFDGLRRTRTGTSYARAGTDAGRGHQRRKVSGGRRGRRSHMGPWLDAWDAEAPRRSGAIRPVDYFSVPTYRCIYGDVNLRGSGLNLLPPAGQFRPRVRCGCGRLLGAGGEFLLVGAHPTSRAESALGRLRQGGIMSSAGHRVHVRPGIFSQIGLGGGAPFLVWPLFRLVVV